MDLLTNKLREANMTFYIHWDISGIFVIAFPVDVYKVENNNEVPRASCKSALLARKVPLGLAETLILAIYSRRRYNDLCSQFYQHCTYAYTHMVFCQIDA